jgi:glucoselysine-6-phosphate deglycase
MQYSDDRGCLNWQVSTLDSKTDERTLALLGSGSPFTAPFETMLFFQVLSTIGSDYLGINCDTPRYPDFYDVMNTKSKQ